jgi:hypothetical protein
MIQLCPLASQKTAGEAPVPAAPPPIWSQLPAARQQQALQILAQMLRQVQSEEAGHDQCE